ncbi:magnesium/cobalt transporter CorA [Sporosarcina pasteurii]|uniref:Magnesium transport protein CorA n=1 Tax=Sporosarcina pasteurii TaxID=1474 RepID=A0A380BXE1_SPOPA|nr:magnesium/cobalt transporter CorA [Sporosarcina pasteurii]MDS9471390.1 magnesium/cobalt transporter CorA [Sporosarcina pasteurii]QBQ04982.1 magnesium/cobalt transporter CorA [Sporosarcina pasteurii]SUJ08773.1 Magnesium transport protein CorA [Sporosarcina pasteurii]
MIHTIGFTDENELLFDFPLSEIHTQNFLWYWVDFDRPTGEEINLLHSFFQFHPLAIEDCLQRLQRPKLNYYEDYTFFVLHSISQEDLEAEEVNMFFGTNYVVTFHFHEPQELKDAKERIIQNPTKWEEGHVFTAYQIIDKIVDSYFPILYKIEDHLNDIEEKLSPSTVHLSMDFVFDVRSDLLRLRRTIIPMRELLYRMLNSEVLSFSITERAYFSDIHDHLLRLVEILELNRDLTSDIRDSQLSINSNQMNRIMMMLTIISSVFIPLTFIAGVYGMNFEHMPELRWRYSYLAVMAMMIFIGIAMLLWFKHRGWLRIFKS